MSEGTGFSEVPIGEKDIKAHIDAAPEENSDKQYKKAAWENKRAEIDQIGDRLGLGIDEGIKDTVVVVNLLGINTFMSCEGHLDHGVPNPNIMFAAPDMPKWRFNREEEVFKRVAAENSVTIDDLRHLERDGQFDEQIREAHKAARNEARESGESEEHKAWREETNRTRQKVEVYMIEFYLNREKDDRTRLQLHPLDDGEYVLQTGPDEEFEAYIQGKELEYREGEKQELLEARQAEMAAFTEFLKEKYFAGEQGDIG
jgi:hypothetical protein